MNTAPRPPDWQAVDRWRLRATWSAALLSLPGEWAPRLRRLVADATAAEPVWHRVSAAREILADWCERFPGAGLADQSRAEIEQQAQKLADAAASLGFGRLALDTDADPWPEWVRLCDWIERHHGIPPRMRGTECIRRQLSGLVRRACCARWWRRQLRRYTTRAAEAAAIELGVVSAASGQLYCSDRAIRRHRQQQEASEEAMKSRQVENPGGQRFTLWDVAQRGIGNRAIRRGELMTRVRGAEEIAEETGLRGMFWTFTAPSRFHSRDHRTGIRNSRYQSGLSPRDGQMWLRATWATARTRLKDRGIRVMGVRVAEPHHDGCPHWHMVLWTAAEHVEAARDLLIRTWLEDTPDEPGARRHRAKWLPMNSGGACAYVAKYIAKNIDAALSRTQPAHLEHVDDVPALPEHQAELLDARPVTPAGRVEAWSSAWGIRQFQLVGMPPVSVWRELRRVHPAAIEGRGDPALVEAWRCAHRDGERRADWAGYCRAQGGVMRPLTEYRARVRAREIERAGGYDEGRTVRVPVGVTTDRTEALHQYAPSMRQPWGGPGLGAQVRAAWLVWLAASRVHCLAPSAWQQVARAPAADCCRWLPRPATRPRRLARRVQRASRLGRLPPARAAALPARTRVLPAAARLVGLAGLVLNLVCCAPPPHPRPTAQARALGPIRPPARLRRCGGSPFGRAARGAGALAGAAAAPAGPSSAALRAACGSRFRGWLCLCLLAALRRCLGLDRARAPHLQPGIERLRGAVEHPRNRTARDTALHQVVDLARAVVEHELFHRARGAAELDALGLQSLQGFARARADQIALDLGREREHRREDF